MISLNEGDGKNFTNQFYKIVNRQRRIKTSIPGLYRILIPFISYKNDPITKIKRESEQDKKFTFTVIVE